LTIEAKCVTGIWRGEVARLGVVYDRLEATSGKEDGVDPIAKVGRQHQLLNG